MQIPPRSTFERSHETGLLVEMLMRLKPGEILPWATICSALGMPKLKAMSHCASARRIVLSEHNIVVHAVRGQGLMRLENGALSRAWEGRANTARTQAHKGLRELSCAEYDALSSEERVAHCTGRTVLAMVRQTTKPRTMKKLAHVVQREKRELPISQILIALGGEDTNGK